MREHDSSQTSLIVSSRAQEAKKRLFEVAKGTGIAFWGLLLAKVIKYVTRILIVRKAGLAAYGLLNLGLAVISLLAVFALLGLPKCRLS